MSKVNLPQSVIVDIEGIGVLHDEFAAAQNARPRPGLVAVLGLNLEQQHGKVFVGAVFALDREGEQFFVRGPEQIVVVAAVLEPKDPVAVFGPAVCRLIGRARQQRREQDLLATDADHLLAHDVLDLAQHPQAQR